MCVQLRGQHLLPYVFERGSLTDGELTPHTLARMASWRAPWNLPFFNPLPQLIDTHCHICFVLIYVCFVFFSCRYWVSALRSSYLYGKHFTHGAMYTVHLVPFRFARGMHRTQGNSLLAVVLFIMVSLYPQHSHSKAPQLRLKTVDSKKFNM